MISRSLMKLLYWFWDLRPLDHWLIHWGIEFLCFRTNVNTQEIIFISPQSRYVRPDMFAHQNFKNSFSLGYTPTYREANVPQSYNFVQNGQIRDGWYGSMHLDEQNRTISGPPGFEHFKQSYSSALRWTRGTLACYPFSLFTCSSWSF